MVAVNGVKLEAPVRELEEEHRQAHEDFLNDYRKTGLKWATYACAVAALLLLLFLVVPGVSLANRSSPHVLATRLAMLVCLAGVIAVLSIGREFAVRRYPPVSYTHLTLPTSDLV